LDTAALAAVRHQIIAIRGGATLAKREVVLLRTAFIAVAGDPDIDLGILPKPGGLLVQRRDRLGIEIVAIRVEEDAVAGALDQVFLAAGRRIAGTAATRTHA